MRGVLGIGVVLVVLGAAVAVPGVAADSVDERGPETGGYTIVGTGPDSPTSHVFAVYDDEPLIDGDDEMDDAEGEEDEEDEQDDGDDDEDEEDDDEENDDEENDDEENDGDDDEDDEDDDEENDGDDDEDEEDDDEENDGDDDEDDEDDDEENDGDDDEDDENDDEENDGDDDEIDEDDDENDEEVGDADKNERENNEGVNAILEKITDGTTSSHSSQGQPGSQQLAANTTTQTLTTTTSTTTTAISTAAPVQTTSTKTPTPTTSTTSSPSQTTTVTESAAPATFVLSNATADHTSLVPGETLRVIVEVENRGGQTGTYHGQLRVDGEVVDTASSTIDAGETMEVAFEHRFDDSGDYEVAVDELAFGTVTVTEPTTERDETTRGTTAEGEDQPVQVVDAEVPADWVRVDARTNVRATVVNTENQRMNETLFVTIDGNVVGREMISLQPYERRVVSVEFRAADGEISVGGFDVGTIDVRNDTADSVTERIESSTGSETDADHDLYILAALLGLLLGGLGFFGVTRR